MPVVVVVWGACDWSFDDPGRCNPSGPDESRDPKTDKRSPA
jgi:hypothetical protein